MLFSEVTQLVQSTGFPSRVITSLGLNSNCMDEQDMELIPERYIRLCQKAEEFLALESGDDIHLYSCPGRLIYVGKHSENWGGTSLGAAVNPDILALLRFREDEQVVLYSEGYEHPFHIDTSDTDVRADEEGSSAAIIRGAASLLRRNSVEIRGFDAYLNSAVLPGGGLNASTAFAVMMIYCLSDNPAGKSDHPLKSRGILVSSMVKEIEERYFGEEGDLSSPSIIWNGGLQLSVNHPEFSTTRIEQNSGFFDRRQYIVDSLNTSLDSENAYVHLHEEIRKIHSLEDNNILNPERFMDFTQEDIVLIHFFLTEKSRIQSIVHSLRSGNMDRMKHLYQEYLHEYRHILNLIHRKSGSYNDKLELLHSILSIYKMGENVEIIHGPLGSGIDSKAFFMIDRGYARNLEEILTRFFDYLTIVPVFPREKGCMRLL